MSRSELESLCKEYASNETKLRDGIEAHGAQYWYSQARHWMDRTLRSEEHSRQKDDLIRHLDAENACLKKALKFTDSDLAEFRSFVRELATRWGVSDATDSTQQD